MDKNLLFNIERVLLQARIEIDNNNKQLFIILLSCFTLKSSNKAFYLLCENSGYCYDYLLNASGIIVGIDGYAKEILLIEQCLRDIINSINAENFNMAKDIADAFHFIPRIIAEQRILHICDFKKTILYPLKNKWHLCYKM